MKGFRSNIQSCKTSLEGNIILPHPIQLRTRLRMVDLIMQWGNQTQPPRPYSYRTNWKTTSPLNCHTPRIWVLQPSRSFGGQYYASNFKLELSKAKVWEFETSAAQFCFLHWMILFAYTPSVYLATTYILQVFKRTKSSPRHGMRLYWYSCPPAKTTFG